MLHGGSLHIIDFQDARMGPDTYDLTALIRDRGVARIIGDEAELELLDHYAAVTSAAGDVRRRYFETLLQRSIKILGTFSAQPILRGRMHYLDFIRPRWTASGAASKNCPSTRRFAICSRWRSTSAPHGSGPLHSITALNDARSSS